MIQLGGLVTALVLAAIAVLHAYWAEGGLWPGRDPADLGEKVLGPVSSRPPRAASWVVAGLLVAAAALIGAVSLGVDNWVATAGAAVAAGVLAVRGGAGLIVSGLARRQSVFARLDRRIYSPLCLTLAALAGLALTLPER